MKYVTWNMGCAPPFARYRRTYADAWRYLLDDLRPDICFVQEALLELPQGVAERGQVVWSEDRGVESGTAIFVRRGLSAASVRLRIAGSYVSAAYVKDEDGPTLVVSVHVGPPRYRRHLRTLVDGLSAVVDGQRFVIGGDLNAARRLDDVQGGRWFRRFFDDMAARHFCDCHWRVHGREVQSFWGHQAREAYQCDHFFADSATATYVSECAVVDNPTVRALSDHGPLVLALEG